MKSIFKCTWNDEDTFIEIDVDNVPTLNLFKYITFEFYQLTGLTQYLESIEEIDAQSNVIRPILRDFQILDQWARSDERWIFETNNPDNMNDLWTNRNLRLGVSTYTKAFLHGNLQLFKDINLQEYYHVWKNLKNHPRYECLKDQFENKVFQSIFSDTYIDLTYFRNNRFYQFLENHLQHIGLDFFLQYYEPIQNSKCKNFFLKQEHMYFIDNKGILDSLYEPDYKNIAGFNLPTENTIGLYLDLISQHNTNINAIDFNIQN